MTKLAKNVQIILVSQSLFSSSILQEFASYSTSPRCFWPSRAKNDSETMTAKWASVKGGGSSLGQRGSDSPKLRVTPVCPVVNIALTTSPDNGVRDQAPMSNIVVASIQTAPTNQSYNN